MTIVYTGTERKHLKSIKSNGLPIGAYVATTPYIAKYYALRTHKRGIVVALNIPNVERYSQITDEYKIGKSLQIVKKPKQQILIGTMRFRL